ncbi:MAG: PAS domain S-box protein [Deltaproteobacteria bacterium]|nr:PAS domain S-box protein [Deltaproteobacteria bacterium]MBN2845244.1 PAS domain S-box protein [Deltaproteobacteria bacterium]
MTNTFLNENIIKYKSIVESIEEAYFVIDLPGHLRFFNDGFSDLLGYTRSELNSMTIQDFTTAETLYRVSEIYRSTKQTKKEVTISGYEIIRKDGSFQTLEITGSFIGDTSGRYHGFHGVAKDETKQWGLKRALEDSEERYRHLIENINEVVYQTDNQGIVTYVSPSVEWTGGYTQAEIIGRPFTDFVYEEDLNGRMDRFREILHGVEDATIYRVRTKDGENKWVRTAARPIHENGYAVGIRGVLTDVTDIVETKEKLRQSEHKYRSILEDIEEGYFEVDLAGNFLFFNDSTCKILGYTSDELVGINNREIMVPESAKKTFQMFNEIFRTGNPRGFIDFEFIKKNGASVIGELSASLMTNDKGEPIGFRGVVRDVTERRLTERAWKQSNFIVNASRDWMTLINRNYEYMAANDAFCRAHGKARDEIIGRTVAELWGEKTFYQSIKNNIDRCFAGEEINYKTSFDEESFKSQHFEVTYYPFRNEKGVIEHVVVASHDMTKRMRAENSMQESLSELEGALEKTVNCLVSAFEMRDPYTAGHQRRVAELARAIAQAMDFTEDEIQVLHLASLVHDIGKIHLPIEILSKPTPLTVTEFGIIKMHSQVGYEILKKADFPWPIDTIVLQHHERLNGQGYPRGLKKDDIVIEAQIIAVADVVEAMSSHRPYRPALSIDIAIEEILANKGILYNAEVVDICVDLFRNKNFELRS